MEKIFAVISDTSMSQSDFSTVNQYLHDNNATVKLVTPITQHGENNYRKYGVIIVVSTAD